MEYLMNFGKTLTGILAERGISKAHMARKLGVSPQMFQHIAKSKDVKLTLAVKIAKELSLTVYDFLGDEYGGR